MRRHERGFVELEPEAGEKTRIGRNRIGPID